MRKLSVRQLIVAGALAWAVAALAMLVGVLGFFTAMQRELHRETDAVLEDERLAGRITGNLYAQLLEASRYTQDPSPAGLAAFREHGTSVFHDIRLYLFRNLSSEERLLVERLKERHQELEVLAQDAFDLAARGRTGEAREHAALMFRSADSLQAKLGRLVRLRHQVRTSLEMRQASALKGLYVLSLALASIFGLVIVLLTRFLRGRLLLPLEELSAAAARLGAGDLETRVPVRHNDELAAVARSFNRMAENLEVAHTQREAAEQAIRQRDEQLRQAEKTEAIGRMAGGIAHDFNNLLTAIQGHTRLLLDSPGCPPYIRADLEEVDRAAERAATLTRQLLAFGRKQVLLPRILDLNVLITDIGKMLGRLIGEHIDLRFELAPHAVCVRADPSQLGQVLVNLVVNARDALANGGTITVETCEVEVDDAFARRRAGLEPGSYVMLAVSDTGVGMDEETLARVFEPFFTTKQVGKGTGLGLSTVYGIVKQSGGHIEGKSQPGRGSRFDIYLPRVEPEPQESPAPAAARQGSGGSETVLLVEDELAVRSLARSVLERSGYNVLEAQDGEHALGLAREYGAAIDLLLTDVVMPGMSGKQLADRLWLVCPRTRVLFMSGYALPEFAESPEGAGTHWLLAKPFTPEKLALKVRQVLDSRDSRAATG
ncbi:MAG: response regulator [Gemmatimonadetes bacterium]|nr:response regulator [Gemmatimonadota bacterium]